VRRFFEAALLAALPDFLLLDLCADFTDRLTAVFRAGARRVGFLIARTLVVAFLTDATVSLAAVDRDFCAAPARATNVPKVEPIVSATLVSNPESLSEDPLPEEFSAAINLHPSAVADTQRTHDQSVRAPRESSAENSCAVAAKAQLHAR
jgi:hypothetical protein